MEPSRQIFEGFATLDSYEATDFLESLSLDAPPEQSSVESAEAYRTSKILISISDLFPANIELFINKEPIEAREYRIQKQEHDQEQHLYSECYIIPATPNDAINIKITRAEVIDSSGEIHIARLDTQQPMKSPPKGIWNKFINKCWRCKQIVRFLISLLMGGLDPEDLLEMLGALLEEMGINLRILNSILEFLEKWGKRAVANHVCIEIGHCPEDN